MSHYYIIGRLSGCDIAFMQKMKKEFSEINVSEEFEFSLGENNTWYFLCRYGYELHKMKYIFYGYCVCSLKENWHFFVDIDNVEKL